MKMQRKIYPLPDHPRTKVKQHIVIEQPDPKSVWYLVIENDKAKPLVGLDKPPKTAKEVLDVFAKEYGEDNVAQFVMQGYSLVNMVSRL